MGRPGKAQRRPDLTTEFELLRDGFSRIAGLDEAGRGAWAGPVIAAAVILPLQRFDLVRSLEGVRDSITVGLGVASAEEVDQLGLIVATREAMTRALTDLCTPPEHLLIDHLRLPEVALPQTALTRGDSRVLSIAAASVIAKVARDQAMVALDASFPGYGFARHKGYGTAEHRAALKRLGPCPFHRLTYAPVAACGSPT